MKKKNEVEAIYNRLTAAAPKARTTLLAIEAYTAIRVLRCVLDCDTAENNLEEIVEAIEGTPASR